MNKTTLLRVLELRKETSDCLSILLERPKKFQYQAGDCLYLSFPDEPLLGKQTYSFASSPTEDRLMITFKKGYSEFKHKLEAVQQGVALQAVQYGSNFIFDPEKESVMIAGGIGITPLRSMIKTRLIEYPTVRTILLFQNKTQDFPFYSELSQWQKEHPSLDIHWLDTDTKGRLTPEMLTPILGEMRDTFHYYVAGPPLMVDASIELLNKLMIRTPDIHTDSFDGYTDEIS